MAITLLTDHVWQTLTAATKARVKPAVAVAYFGQGAAKLLPLPNGSRIVVDASEGAVKSGQTCPAELIKLLKRGVRIYSRKNLHEATLIEILIHETTRALGRDANFLGKQIEVRRRSGEPNWDANCGISGTVVVKAFGIALAKVQEQYDLD